jgi:hypothetical protein
MEVDIFDLNTTLRWEEKASHKMKINSIKATNDSKDPNEDTTFHIMKASG